MRLYRVAEAFLANGADPDDVDDWLAPQVLEDSHLEMIVQDIATIPLKAIWQWSRFPTAAICPSLDVCMTELVLRSEAT